MLLFGSRLHAACLVLALVPRRPDHLKDFLILFDESVLIRILGSDNCVERQHFMTDETLRLPRLGGPMDRLGLARFGLVAAHWILSNDIFRVLGVPR